MHVIVAGGSGFVGRHVVAALEARGHRVTVLARGTREGPAGVESVACDVARGPLPVERLAGADAIVNLVGIKREAGTQTFEAVHVEATRRLLDAGRALGVRRFVHVSVVCSRPDPALPYHDSKWRAEQLVRGGGLPFTILRPGVIYGLGDDMITHLVKLIRFAPVFPVVGRGESILQPVDVRDVAEAVAAALERPAAAGGCYDVVGGERLTLRRLVRTVADGLDLRLLILPTPLSLQRLAVRVMNVLTARPLSTPAQLRMLADGMPGDPEPARRELGLVPRRFDAGVVRGLEGAIPALFGVSLRLVDRREHATWIRARAPQLPRALALAAGALVLLPILSAPIGPVWPRMAANALLLLPIALLGVRPGWRELLTPSARHAAQGVGAAAVLYALGAAVFHLVAGVSSLAGQIATVYAWRATANARAILPLLLLIIVAEELVWRNAILLPLAGRLGPWPGVLAAGVGFGAAHLSLGVPLLVVAALGAATFWGALVVKTRSAIPALVCHVLWDVSVLFVFPYARS